MARRRSILWHGLLLVVKVPGGLLWTYALNLGLAFLFSIRIHAQLASILDRSLEAQRLNTAFDLGVLNEAIHRISYMAPSTGSSSYGGLPLYLLCYFVLVPGTLFSYRSEAPSGLASLAGAGIAYFWRFVRITLLTAVISAAILVPLMLLQTAWSTYIDERVVGLPAVLYELTGAIFIALVAALLRLYFDLVEVYVMQLGDRQRSNGKQDRRVRRTLLPALRALRGNFVRAYCVFVALALIGVIAVAWTGQVAIHMLAQPRVWPAFLLVQAGLFAMLATRFWQRGAETILACDYPLPPSVPVLPVAPLAPAELGGRYPNDPLSDPEPAVPSLPEPDPGVFHHDVPPVHEPEQEQN
jgi:hypothetical protein